MYPRNLWIVFSELSGICQVTQVGTDCAQSLLYSSREFFEIGTFESFISPGRNAVGGVVVELLTATQQGKVTVGNHTRITLGLGLGKYEY